jgi:hypothetical protein
MTDLDALLKLVAENNLEGVKPKDLKKFNAMQLIAETWREIRELRNWLQSEKAILKERAKKERNKAISEGMKKAAVEKGHKYGGHKYGRKAKVNLKQVRSMLKQGKSQAQIARHYKVSPARISQIVKGEK